MEYPLAMQCCNTNGYPIGKLPWNVGRGTTHLQVGDSEEDPIVMSDDEEEVEAPPSSEESYHAPSLAEHIGPVYTGQ